MSSQPILVSESESRPAWAEKTPDLELDARHSTAGDSFFLSVLAAVDHLLPGQILSIRTEFEPILMYSILDKKGFESWSQRGEGGDWTVWFHKRCWS